jgi:alpha-amylase
MVDNWQIKDFSLGFSRGSKGFIAMGEFDGKQFYTGMPDGEYCDVISECAQKVTVSGGMATVRAYQSNDPVLAICVGCQ